MIMVVTLNVISVDIYVYANTMANLQKKDDY